MFNEHYNVHHLENWCKSTFWEISSEKTLITIGMDDYNEQVMTGNKQVQIVDSMKYLGMMINKSTNCNERLKLC